MTMTRRLSLALVVLLGAVLLAPLLVSAAVPQYVIVEDVNTTLSNEADQLVGTLLFVKQAPTPEQLVVSSFGSFSAERFDELLWSNSSSSIQVTSPAGLTSLRSAGEPYRFSEQGVYSYRSLQNASLAGSVSVAPERVLSVDLVPRLSTWDVSFSPSSFSLVGSERRVNFSVSVPQQLPPLEEELVVDVFTNAANETLSYELVLPEVKRWSVNSSLPSNVTLGGGSSVDVGSLLVDNLGNVNFEALINVSGSGADFVSSPRSLMLFRNSVNSFDFRAQVPSRTADGEYPVVVDLLAGGRSERFNFTVFVRDTSPPVIDDVSLSSSFASRESSFLVRASDNIGVDEVSVSVGEWRSSGNSSVNASSGNASLEFFADASYSLVEDSGVWRLADDEVLFPEAGDFSLFVCAFDSSRNRGCVNETVSVLRLDLVDKSNRVTFPTRKYGAFSEVMLLNLTERPPSGFFVRLDSFEPDFSVDSSRPLLGGDGALFRVRLVDGDGSFKEFTRLNSSVELSSEGPVFLQVRASEESVAGRRLAVSGSLSFHPPSSMVSLTDSSFAGEFAQFDLPPPFEMGFGTGGRLSCLTEDTGVLESSRVVCELVYPASLVSGDDLLVPITQSERAFVDGRVASVEEDFSSRLLLRNVLAGLSLSLLALLLVYHFVMLYVRPHWFWLRRD